MTINTVIFDMDGVLIDAREWHYLALNDALSLFGCPISRDLHLIKYDGLPTRKKLQMLVNERLLPDDLIDIVSDLKQDFTIERIYKNCKPVFNHMKALNILKSRGYKVALCSNSIRETVDLMLSKAGLTSYFDLTLSNTDVAKPKPAPDIYLTAMKILGSTPRETIIFEDNENGIEAARCSGANVSVVKDPKEVTIEKILQEISIC